MESNLGEVGRYLSVLIDPNSRFDSVGEDRVTCGILGIPVPGKNLDEKGSFQPTLSIRLARFGIIALKARFKSEIELRPAQRIYADGAQLN